MSHTFTDMIRSAPRTPCERGCKYIDICRAGACGCRRFATYESEHTPKKTRSALVPPRRMPDLYSLDSLAYRMMVES